MRSGRLWIAICLGVIAAASGGLIWAKERRCRLELDRGQARDGERFGSSRAPAARQADHQCPGIGRGPLFQLGLCEESLDHPVAAEMAWSQISTKSSLGRQASLGRARLLMNAGRFAPAESLLLSIPNGDIAVGRQVRQSLELLYRSPGTYAGNSRVHRRNVGASGRPVRRAKAPLSARSLGVSG